MSKEKLKALKELRVSAERYAPEIEKMLAKSGMKANKALVYAAAKYYKTLEKLAKE